MQHLHVPHLRGRVGRKSRNELAEKKRAEADAESTEEVDKSGKAEGSGKGGRGKKDRADRKKKARTTTSSDVVKGLKKEAELETTNLDKRGNESETTDSVEQFDLDELNYIMAMRKWRQQKPTPT